LLGYGDLMVFQNGSHPPSWISKNLKCYLPVGLRGSKSIIMTSFVKMIELLLRYGGLTILKMVAISHVGFLKLPNFDYR